LRQLLFETAQPTARYHHHLYCRRLHHDSRSFFSTPSPSSHAVIKANPRTSSFLLCPLPPHPSRSCLCEAAFFSHHPPSFQLQCWSLSFLVRLANLQYPSSTPAVAIIIMPSFATLLSTAALLALAQAHGVLVVAQGEKGSPNSVGFQGKSELQRLVDGGETYTVRGIS